MVERAASVRGTIAVTPAHGGGTLVSVTLPAAAASHAEVTSSTAASAS
jgi:nitrate/nitrite-specific signal transduction histidine kinase